MRILYDSKKTEYKKPFGCLRQNEECTINLYIPQSCMTESTAIVLEGQKYGKYTVDMKKTDCLDGYDIWTSVFSLENCDLYFYYFHIDTKEGSFDLFKEGEGDTNIGVGEKWQLTCFEKDYDTPDDFKGKVMYQIFPDRFAKGEGVVPEGKLEPYWIHTDTAELPEWRPDANGKILNNDFFGGNLRGIAEKLEYIKDLGVSVIYLNPIFMAYSNHRYDTCDYKRIDPLLGEEKDFSDLCEKAHGLGIKIILDGVFSHTGSNSIYFDKENIFGNGAFSNPASPYKSWFRFSEYPHSYESWWGIDTLPCVEEMSEDYIKYIITDEDSVVRHWLRLGADGFRLDVADELPDEFIKLLHDTVKEEKKNSIVIGEVWEDASNKIAYDIRRRYFADTELDSVMNYPFMNGIIAYAKGDMSGKDFASLIMTIAENYPEPVLHCLMNSLSTHDTARIFTVLSGADIYIPRDIAAETTLTREQKAKARCGLMTAVMLQFVLPGTACIYYGDEIGTEGFGDPFNRSFFDWSRQDDSLRNYFRHMAQLKNSYSQLSTGNVNVYDKEDVLFVERYNSEGCVTAIINKGDSDYVLKGKKLLAAHNVTVAGDVVYVNCGGYALYI